MEKSRRLDRSWAVGEVCPYRHHVDRAVRKRLNWIVSRVSVLIHWQHYKAAMVANQPNGLLLFADVNY